MSRIPTFGGGNRPSNVSTTFSSKTPRGGSRTVTTSSARELQPIETDAGNAPCQTCGDKSKSSREPSKTPSGIPTSSRIAQRSMAMARSRAERQQPQQEVPQEVAAPRGKGGKGGCAPTCKGGDKSSQDERKYHVKSVADLPVPIDLSGEITSRFDMKARKRQRISEYMCKTIRKTKLKAIEKMAEDGRRPLILTRPASCREMRFFAEKCPINGMSRFLEKRIRQKIGVTDLEARFPQLATAIMEEAKMEFRKNTHSAGLGLKVRDCVERFTIAPYRFLGKTENYNYFVCVKKQLEHRWILHNEVLRNLLTMCIVELPAVLFEVRIRQPLNLEDLQAVFKEKINNATLTVNDFHRAVRVLLKGSSKNRPASNNFPAACSGLFSIYVSDCIGRTMENVLKFIRVACSSPFLRLQVDFDSNLLLTPAMEQVVQVFHVFLDDLIELGNDFDALERKAVKPHLCVTSEFIERCKRTVTHDVMELYRPVMDFIEKLGSNFTEIYSDVNGDNSYYCSEGGGNFAFEEGCRRIQHYKNFLRRVACIPDNEYFQIGRLELKDYREKLYEKLRKLSDSIFDNLASQHFREVSDICESFQLIKNKATHKPDSTEELIEIGKFMAWIKNEQLESLTERVHTALHLLSTLITLGILTEDHLKVNSAALNWIEEIPPVIEEYTTTFEQLKFEAEEKLQKVIEDINVHITDTYPLLVVLDDMDDIKNVRNYLNKITLHMNKIKDVQAEIEWINREEVCLNFPKSTYAEFDCLKDYVYPFYRLLKLSLNIQKRLSVWRDGQFDLLDYESAETTVAEFETELARTQQVYRKKLRRMQDENVPVRFKGTVDDPDPLNWPAPLKLCGQTANLLREFKPSLTVMRIVCNAALRPRHWTAMSDIAGFNLRPDAGTTLKKMMELNLQERLKEYEIISICATKERQLLDELDRLKAQWQDVRFVFQRTTEGVCLSGLEEVAALAEEQRVQIAAMTSSVFVKPHESDVKTFDDTLSNIVSMTSGWRALQDACLRLNVVILLLEDRKLFATCHALFRAYGESIAKDPRVLRVVAKSNIAEDLEKTAVQLETIQKTVDDHLEMSRLQCPRLCFVSNEEAVDLIRSFHTAGTIEAEHLVKLFPGMARLEVEAAKVTSIVSTFGERIALKNPIEMIDRTLGSLINAVGSEAVRTLKSKSANCYKIYKKSSIQELLAKYSQQCLQLMALVFWTDQVESALKLSHNLKLMLYKTKLVESIEEKIAIINRQPISNVQRRIYQNLLLTDLNNKYVMSRLFGDGLVIDDKHFDWQAQLKYYFRNGLCSIGVLGRDLSYGYELAGNEEGIVLTPQTDRCFVALLNAYFCHFHATLLGGRETGKSATIRALATTLGRAFFAVSCTQPQSIVRALKGSALSGAWLSIRDFDRLSMEAVSGLSQDLLAILQSKRKESADVTLGGVSMPFDNTCFVTIQLSFEAKLPENFRTLCRRFTLSRPDLGAVAESLLVCKGVSQARLYGRTLQHCFAALEDALIGQRQVTFEMSRLKQVLDDFEGRLRQAPAVDGLQLLCRSLWSMFLSSFDGTDRRLFEAVLRDIFQEDFQSDDREKSDLLTRLDGLSLELKLYMDCGFREAIIKAYNGLNRSKNLILLGNPGTAKSTILKCCKSLFDCPVDLHVLSPVLKSTLLVKAILRTSIKTWIVFDGRLTPNCTEDLLDGSPIAADVSFIFETRSLDEGSPALISRCNTIYFQPQSVNYVSIVETWWMRCTSDWTAEQMRVKEWLLWCLPACLSALEDGLFEPLWRIEPNTLVTNALGFLQLILDDAYSSAHRQDEDPKNLLTWTHAALLQAGVLGLCGAMAPESRLKFDEFYKQLWKGQNPKWPYPKGVDRLEVGIPAEGLLFDYCYLYKQRGTWKLYADLLKNEKILERPQVIVPTVDTIRTSRFLDLHIKYGKRLLIVGNESSGKSMGLRDCFANRLPEDEYEKTIVTCRESCSARELQELLLTNFNEADWCSTRRFACFVEDLHRSSDSAVELLKRHLDGNPWYDAKTSKPIALRDVTFVATASAPTKLLRYFSVLGIGDCSRETVVRIYQQYLFREWKKSGFPSDALASVNAIVHGSVGLLDRVKLRFKASPANCHYRFDMRSLSKLFAACVMLKKEAFDGNKRVHVRLWAHEATRVFGDRLATQDSADLKRLLAETLREEFPDDDPIQLVEGLYFGTFKHRLLEGAARHYEEVSLAYLKETCLRCLDDFNGKARFKLDLVFFDYALEKLVQLCRLLSIAGENGLLLGEAGRGRRSLCKFAGFLYDFQVFHTSYDSRTLKEHFKRVLKLCGGRNERYVFLVAEYELANDDDGEGLLEVMDHYGREGDVTDLFDREERRDVVELARLAAQGGNRFLDVSVHKVLAHFNERCRANLHVFLSLDATKGRRLSRHPSLGARFSVIHWADWPDDCLVAVAQRWIRSASLSDEVKERCVRTSIEFHRTCQADGRLAVNARNFVHMYQLISDLVTCKQEAIAAKRQRYLRGLAKLSYAADQIVTMQQSLAEYRPQLEAMTRNSTEMTEQIALETVQVERASAQVRRDERVAGEQAAIAQSLKAECESELAQAIPILEDAICALNTLKPTDITLVKSMKNPPDAVKLVMASVCVIKEVKPDRVPDPGTGKKIVDYWGPSKRILGDINFLQTLKDFDKDRIRPEIVAKLRKDYLPHKDFRPQVVAKASSAAEGLCKWIIAIDMYDKVAKEVAPKKEKLDKAEKEYAETMLVLNRKKEEVIRLEEKLAELNAQLGAATEKRAKLQTQVDRCNRKLVSAQKLIGSLSAERARWTEIADSLRERYDALPGDILASGAIIAYLAPLPSEARASLITTLRQFIKIGQVPASHQDFDLGLTLCDRAQIDRWRQDFALPSVEFFTENSVIFQHTRLFSLFLDPEHKALQWITNLEANNNLTVTKLTFTGWLGDLKRCVSEGKPIVLKDTTGHIPYCLSHLIFGQTFTDNGRICVQIDGELVWIHEASRVYLICNQENPSVHAEIRSRMTVVNFALTAEALRKDALKMVVEIEKPQVRKWISEVESGNKRNKAELERLNSTILDTLCESDADLLADERSILLLDRSKELVKMTLAQQDGTVQLTKAIEAFKRQYFEVAKNVSTLYFTIDKLKKLHYLYRFSLKWFMDVYFVSILEAGKSRDVKVRCDNIYATFTYNLFKNINRGVFERHKFLLLFWLALGVAVCKRTVAKDEIDSFFSAPEDLECAALESNAPPVAWLSKASWVELLRFDRNGFLQGIVDSMVTNSDLWQAFAQSASGQLPSLWNESSHLRRLTLVRLLKPERLLEEATAFAATILDSRYLSPPFFNLQDTYNESYSLVPVIFILTSEESNVSETIGRFAEAKRVLHKFKHLSLTKGESREWIELLDEARKDGSWVLLENGHYLERSESFILEQHLERMDFRNTHEDFRLFLSLDQEAEFPIDLIQSSIRIVDEACSNTKRNLLRLYERSPIASDDYYYGCPDRQDIFARLLYGLVYCHCLFGQRHRMCHDRNVPYSFGLSTLELSLEQLKRFVNEPTCLSEKIKYVIDECTYGGQLAEPWQKRFVSAHLEECLDVSKPHHFPSKNDRRDHLRHIASLPEIEANPEMLFLTEADVVRFERSEAARFMDCGRALVPTSRQEAVESDVLESITSELLASFPRSLNTKHDDACVERELKAYERLLEEIHGSLALLAHALRGARAWSRECEDVASSLRHNRVPCQWLKFYFPSSVGLSRFARNVVENIKYLEDFRRDSDRVLFRAFYFPQSIVTARKVEVSKSVSIPFHLVHFDYRLSSGEDVEAREVLVLDELHLLGARYSLETDRIECLPPKAYYSVLPPVIVRPTAVAVRDGQPQTLQCFVFKTEKPLATCAVYGTASVITSVRLPCGSDEKFWIRRGITIVCEISD